MAISDTFNGAKNALVLFYAYLNMVGQDIGMERAFALDTKMWEMIGTGNGKTLKEQTGIDEIGAAAAASCTLVEEALGISSEIIQESAQRSVLKSVGVPFTRQLWSWEWMARPLRPCAALVRSGIWT